MLLKAEVNMNDIIIFYSLNSEEVARTKLLPSLQAIFRGNITLQSIIKTKHIIMNETKLGFIPDSTQVNTKESIILCRLMNEHPGLIYIYDDKGQIPWDKY